MGGLPATALAQPGGSPQGHVRGAVVDADTGAPLLGATVSVPALNRGTVTDRAGAYALRLPAGPHTVAVRHVGFLPTVVEVTVAEGATVAQDIRLEADLTGLEDVVITGALSKRSRTTSEVAVARIDAAELTEIVPYSGIEQLVSGKITGVTVRTSSGNVGGGVRFNVRSGGGLNGDGQPLIFIDGVRVVSDEEPGWYAGGQGISLLSDLNPDDIASIDVLKGPAAAALYGTDASNGVVLIETKKGTLAAGDAPVFWVDYRGTFGVNTQHTAYTAATAFRTFEDANAVFRDGSIQQHTLGISGGSQSVRYFAQMDVRDEDGILRNNAQLRRALRGNVEVFPSERVQLTLSTSFSRNEVARPVNDNSIRGLFVNVLESTEAYAFTDSSSILGISNLYSSNRFLGSARLYISPAEGLSLNLTAGGDWMRGRGDETLPSNLLYRGLVSGERSVFYRSDDRYTVDGNAAYTYQLAKAIHATTTVGVQAFDHRYEDTALRVRDFATELITSVGAGANYVATSELAEHARQFGWLAEQSFSYADTYVLAAGVRRDYASALGTRTPSIYYPVVRGAARLDQLDVMPDLFGLFKLRAAYGQSGQLPGVYDGVPLIWTSFVGGDGAGAQPLLAGNASIKPERVAELEVGLDADLGNRLGLEVTYYRQRATDSIFEVPQAPSTGLFLSDLPLNVGRIDGQGLEVGVTYTPVRTRAHQVDLRFQFSTQSNEVQSLGVGLPVLDGPYAIQPGLPRAAFYATPVHGALFDEDGVYAGVDAGVIADNEDCSAEDNRCFIGTPYPTFNGAFSVSARLFRDVRVYALAEFATGLHVWNSTRQFQANQGNDRRSAELADQLGFTTEFGEDGSVIDAGDFPDLVPGTDAYTEAAHAYARTSTEYDANYIEPGDFLKLREVSIRYDFSRLLARSPLGRRVRTAALAIAGRNLFTSSPYSGPDPEVNWSGTRTLAHGDDFFTLQNPRTYTVTLSLGF